MASFVLDRVDKKVTIYLTHPQQDVNIRKRAYMSDRYPVAPCSSLVFEACIKLMADWLYEEVGKIFLPDPRLCDKVNQELHVPVTAFIENVNRLRAVLGALSALGRDGFA